MIGRQVCCPSSPRKCAQQLHRHTQFIMPISAFGATGRKAGIIAPAGCAGVAVCLALEQRKWRDPGRGPQAPSGTCRCSPVGDHRTRCCSAVGCPGSVAMEASAFLSSSSGRLSNYGGRRTDGEREPRSRQVPEGGDRAGKQNPVFSYAIMRSPPPSAPFSWRSFVGLCTGIA